jgi:ligand-binding sensor domain-containing protein
MDITTIAKNSFNEVWIGTEDGTFFRGDPTMKSMTPFRFSLSSNDIQTIGGDDSFWLGGQLVHLQSGVTYMDIDREIADNYMFNKTINMDETSIFSILELKKEIWFGGENTLLVYNEKQDFWRSYNLRLGGGVSRATSMIDAGEDVWVGSSRGITILNKSNKKPILSKVEEYFNNIYIYDMGG